jgi:membrane associated rhomboid family serine protease
MLIIPIQDRIDWRRPPLVTLALVILNVLLYLASEAYDRPRYEALEELDTEVLTRFEWPLYLEHVKEQDILYFDRLEKRSEASRTDLLWQEWMSREWDQHVRGFWATQTSPDADWVYQRNKLESTRNSLSWIRWGFTPADPTLAGMIGSLFLHGDHWHLFGNMLFLLLFSLALEHHWGARRLLVTYLVAGIAGDLLHWMTAPSSLVPSIGASGAVAGLMGAYVATYGLRRIEFFYTLGFVFGSFKAPALMIFPAWLGKEIFEHVFSDTNVNYMAHAGGLVGGLLMIMLISKWWHRHDQALPAADNAPVPPAPRPATAIPSRLLTLKDQLAFDQATQGARERLQQEPGNALLWEFCLETARRCSPRLLDECITDAFRLLGADSHHDALLMKLLLVYRRQGGDVRRLKPACRLIEAELLYRAQHFAEARREADALATEWQHPRLATLLEKLASAGA